MRLDTAELLLQPGRPWRNWSGLVRAQPLFTARATTVEQVLDVVRQARARGLSVKTVGAGHSFTAIAATAGIQLDISALAGLIDVNFELGQVRLGAGTALHELPDILVPLGLALTNMGDINRQTLAGAVSTGTHGTGARFGGLSTQIVAVTLVTADATILTISATENAELLPAARLGLGALGVIVDLTVQCVPSFLLAAVEKPAGFDEVLDGFLDRSRAVDHFEFYWWPHTDGVLTKSNSRLLGAAGRHPVPPVAGWFEDQVMSNTLLALTCNLGRIAPRVTPVINRLATKVYGNRSYVDDSFEVFVSRRNTRFREMEYSVPIEAIPEALRDVRALIEDRGWRISFPVEVRVAAADDNWLSTAEGRDSGYIAVHRYYKDDHTEYFRGVEEIMRGYGGRPHFGKVHYQNAESLAAVFPHHADFVAVRNRLDPERIFGNRYLERVLGA